MNKTEIKTTLDSLEVQSATIDFDQVTNEQLIDLETRRQPLPNEIEALGATLQIYPQDCNYVLEIRTREEAYVNLLCKWISNKLLK
ncbi:hypothetical protein [Myxosarcina sp. GI1(2024)]